jgi:flagellar FliL protein
MAKEEAVAEVEPPKKKGKMLIIILAVVGVLVIAGGVGAYLLLSKPAVEKDAKHGDEATAEAEHPPVYIKLEPFTVRLADQESFLQTEIQLKAEDPELIEKMKVRLPEVRDAILRTLSSKTGEELSQQDGQDKLAADILDKVHEVLGIKKKSEGVKKVLFVAFIIQ